MKAPFLLVGLGLDVISIRSCFANQLQLSGVTEFYLAKECILSNKSLITFGIG